MVGYVRSIFSSCVYRRVASITTVGIFILCCIPKDAICIPNFKLSKSNQFANGILNQVNSTDTNQLEEGFDKFEEFLSESENPLIEGRNFLQTFVKGINEQYGLTLTIHEACKFVRDNLNLLQIPLE